MRFHGLQSASLDVVVITISHVQRGLLKKGRHIIASFKLLWRSIGALLQPTESIFFSLLLIAKMDKGTTIEIGPSGPMTTFLGGIYWPDKTKPSSILNTSIKTSISKGIRRKNWNSWGGFIPINAIHLKQECPQPEEAIGNPIPRLPCVIILDLLGLLSGERLLSSWFETLSAGRLYFELPRKSNMRFLFRMPRMRFYV